MDTFIELLKAFFIGIVEGITEWLPISSTGHMILVDEFVKLAVSAEFLELFLVVIQLGAILAVVILYFRKLNPFSPAKTRPERKSTWRLWGMVLVGCIPAAVFGLLLDDWVNEHLYSSWVVAAMLIVYGAVFIVIETINRRRASELKCRRSKRDKSQSCSHKEQANSVKEAPRGKHARVEQAAISIEADAGIGEGDIAESALFRIHTVDQIDWKTALKIGFFQVLAIVPGTSRSGATIIGGMLCGCSRTAAAEFTFFLAIPVMLGWGIVKTIKFIFIENVTFTSTEIGVLITGIVTAFIVSILSIKFLMGYIKKNDFTAFGIYRIILGICVIAYFVISGATPDAV